MKNLTALLFAAVAALALSGYATPAARKDAAETGMRAYVGELYPGFEIAGVSCSS